MATDGSASAASESELGSIYPTMQELRAAAAKQADMYMCCWCDVGGNVEGGGGLPVRRDSCRGHRVEPLIADWLKRQITVESQAE